MKDFFYGGVHKKRSGFSLIDEEEEALALKRANEIFRGMMTKEKKMAELAKMDAEKNTISPEKASTLELSESVRPKYSNIKVTSEDNITFYVTGNVDIDLKVINLSSLDNMSLPFNIDTYASDAASTLSEALSNAEATMNTSIIMQNGVPVWIDNGKWVKQKWVYNMTVRVNTRVVKSIYDIQYDDYVLAFVDKYKYTKAKDIKKDYWFTPDGISNGDKIATVQVGSTDRMNTSIHELLHALGLPHIWIDNPGDNPKARYNYMDYSPYDGSNIEGFQVYDIWDKYGLGARQLTEGFKATSIPCTSWTNPKYQSRHGRDLLTSFLNSDAGISYNKEKTK